MGGLGTRLTSLGSHNILLGQWVFPHSVSHLAELLVQPLGGEEEGGGAGAVLGVYCCTVLQEVEGYVLGGCEDVWV